MLFKNKTVLITGGSSGIGAATALRFAEEGANVVISYKSNKAGAEKVANGIKKVGAVALIQKADLCKDTDAKKLVEAVIKKFGKIDVLVNNAGRYINGDEWDGNAEIWTKSLQQNLVSMMSVSKYAVEKFQKQKSGIIVSIASRYASAGQFDTFSYAAAKAGVVNITQAYAKLLAPYGRANSVSPSAVNTGYWLTAPKKELQQTVSETLLKKMVEVSDVVEAIMFLASEKAKMISGQNLAVDGGFSVSR
jgi:3-oxoacyl-[acyl-carrier protein] reductase